MGTQKVFDFIIAGQGIAGTMLHHHLEKAGANVLVADPSDQLSASAISAGIMNPVTGRRLVKTWLACEIFPYAHDLYPVFERFLSTKLYKKFIAYKVFGNEKTRNDWLAKAGLPDMLPYLPEKNAVFLEEELYNNPLGALPIHEAARIDLKKLILLYRNHLKDKHEFARDTVQAKDVKLGQSSVKWKGYTAKKLIFCNGVHAQNTPWFDKLPFNLNKGEILYIKARLREDILVNKGVYILPVGNGNFKIAATNQHKFETDLPSTDGRNELVRKLNRLIMVPYSIIAHHSGIRPSTYNRIPFIGLHPEHPELAVFSGLGSKGASMAPYFAEKLSQKLIHNTPLSPEYDISKLYPESNFRNIL